MLTETETSFILSRADIIQVCIYVSFGVFILGLFIVIINIKYILFILLLLLLLLLFFFFELIFYDILKNHY